MAFGEGCCMHGVLWSQTCYICNRNVPTVYPTPFYTQQVVDMSEVIKKLDKIIALLENLNE